MSDDKPSDTPADRPATPWTKRFRRKAPTTLPTSDQLRRQDAVLRSAWRNLAASDQVITFLNSHNELLGGNPLYLALESDEGLRRVEGLLGEIGAGRGRAGTANQEKPT